MSSFTFNKSKTSLYDVTANTPRYGQMNFRMVMTVNEKNSFGRSGTTGSFYIIDI